MDSLPGSDPGHDLSSTPSSTPLSPMSEQRYNKSAFSSSLRSLDDMSELTPRGLHKHDVQGKVQQFNKLAQESLEKKRQQEAALKRAVLGREEAENEGRRLRETVKALRKELDDSMFREEKALEENKHLEVCTYEMIGVAMTDCG
jgi:hypothetical protein